ncbi:MAG: transglycosylase domain-containing protein [Anaerolineales bacterium]
MSSILTIIHQRRHRRYQTRSSAQQRSQRAVLGFGFILSAVVGALVLAATFTYASLTRSLPPLEQVSLLLNPHDGQLLQPTRFYDRTGQHLIATLAPTDSARTYLAYDQFPQSLVAATLAVSQPDFWSSPGYSIKGWQDPSSHPTLAQRLVFDLVFWDQPASTLRSLHERMLAAQLTARYGSQQVLEWYLNSADYGHYAYGAEAAAQLYFGKSVPQLNLSEAAMLAAVSQAPALNPIDAAPAAEQRRIQTLMVMQALGMLTEDQASQAIATLPTITGETVGGQEDIAPAFINLALSQLDATFGAGRVERGGLVVLTSLDYDLQLQAVCAVQNHLARLAGDPAVIPALDGSTCEAANLLPALQPGESFPGASASVVILDPQTGQILAAVGDTTSSGQGTSLAAHPAGTVITPFIYLTGFSRGLNPASLAWDIPGSVTLPGQVYHGPVRLRTALANDYLPPAQSVLAQMGAESVQNIAASFGLNFPPGLLADDFDLSPVALAGAYAVFADNGTQTGQSAAGAALQPAAVLHVSGVDHSIWADWMTAQSQPLLSPQLAYLMNHVLSDETARWPSLGHPNPLEIGRPAGAKLSHALDSSDAWTVGYTPQRVTVVHLAGPASSAVPPLLSADLWHALMQYAVRDLPSASWEAPPGIVTVSVCDPSGMLPTAACPNVVSEVFLDGRQPVQTDTLYQTFQVNTETGLLATVFTPPELVETRTYMVVPPQASQWAETAGIDTPPTSYDTLQTPPVLPNVHITSPGMFSDSRGMLSILGSAAGADFVSYRLEYGQGLYPQDWMQIGTDSSKPVTEGALGEWDTSGLDGLYALRLMVVRSNQRVDQAVVQVTLDNTPPQIAISYPQAGQELSLAHEPQLALQAQVNDPFLAKVEFYVDDVLVGESDLTPYGVFWQARVGSHTLRVVATDRAGNSAQVSIDFSVK